MFIGQLPLRMRGDRGGENVLICKDISRLRRLDRASYMYDRSTNNKRIEKPWREVGAKVSDRAIQILDEMHQFHGDDIDDPLHQWGFTVCPYSSSSIILKHFYGFPQQPRDIGCWSNSNA